MSSIEGYKFETLLKVVEHRFKIIDFCFQVNVFCYVPTDHLKKQNIILVSLFLLPYCHIFLRDPSEMEIKPLQLCQLFSEAVHICLSGFFKNFFFIFGFLHFEHGMSRC